MPILEPGARTGKSTTDIRAGIGIGEDGDPMFTLQAGKQQGVAHFVRAPTGGGDKPHVPTGVDPRGCFWDGGQVTQTLDAVLHKGQTMPEKNRFPAVLQPVCIHGTQDPDLSDNRAHTLGRNSGQENAVAIGWSEELTAHIELQGTIQRGGDGGRHEGVMQPDKAVRRLTPVECERLQGFPDGHTDVPYRGKPAADGPRYKAIGNSKAVPVVRWLGRRIDAELRRLEAEEDEL